MRDCVTNGQKQPNHPSKRECVYWFIELYAFTHMMDFKTLHSLHLVLFVLEMKMAHDIPHIQVSLEELMTSGPGASSNLTSYDEAALCSTAFRLVILLLIAPSSPLPYLLCNYAFNLPFIP